MAELFNVKTQYVPISSYFWAKKFILTCFSIMSVAAFHHPVVVDHTHVHLQKTGPQNPVQLLPVIIIPCAL